MRQENLFSRGEKLEKLRRAVLPELPGVSSKGMRAVLRCIDDHAREKATCVLSRARIAEETGYSPGHTSAILGGLVSLQLLAIRHRSDADGHRVASELQIIWSNLSAEQEDQSQTAAPLARVRWRDAKVRW